MAPEARRADFRSDTLTRPTAEMRRAMAEAEVGDDVFGEDPTVRALEEEGAQALGVEAALFTPSGTMANQIAIHVHCRPGDEVVCEQRSHVVQYEAGGIARWSGAAVRTLEGARGFPTVAAIEAAVRPDDVHLPRSRLLVLENTHNMAGGTVLGPADLTARAEAARAAGLAVHIDGARLANAATACGVPLSAFTTAVDSVSLCLSKGLGAPVGSLLGGSAEFVHHARRARKAFGGGMRQVGVLAAAGRLALREGFARLAEDHRRAAALGAAFIEAGHRVEGPETNIVMLDLARPDADDLVHWLAARHVFALAIRADRVRFVVHRDLDDDAVLACIDAIRIWTQETLPPTP